MLVTLAVVALLLVIDRPGRLTIFADGIEITARGRDLRSDRVLQRAGVTLDPGDRLLALSGSAFRIDRATSVLVEVDGRELLLRTRAPSIQAALAEAGVSISPHDRLIQDGEEVGVMAPLRPLLPRLLDALRAPAPGSQPEEMVRLVVKRAVPFRVVEEGTQLDFTSSAATVRQALRDAGVSLGPGDQVEPDQDSPLAAGMEVRVQHARTVTVVLPDQEVTLHTLRRHVGEAIEEAGLTLPEVARVDPPLDAPVQDGMTVYVVRISEESDLQKVILPSATVYRPNWGLYPGQTRRVEGHDGAHYWRYSLTLENGQEATRQLTEEWVDEPVDTVIYFSAATANGDNPPPDLPVLRTMRVYATWYSPSTSGNGRQPSDPWYDRTSTGVPVTFGVVAVDPSVIPYGTRMYIPGYGFAVAADTGGGIVGNMIDLGYPDDAVSNWVSRWLEIYILS